MPTLLLCALLVRVSRKSAVLDDRRRAEDVGVGLFGARVTVVARVSVQVTPEVNEIRLLASAIFPSDTVPH